MFSPPKRHRGFWSAGSSPFPWISSNVPDEGSNETTVNFDNIRLTKSQKLDVFHLALQLVFTQFIEVMCKVENGDLVGAAPPTNTQSHLFKLDAAFTCLFTVKQHFSLAVFFIVALIW